MVQLVSHISDGMSYVPNIDYFCKIFQVSATRCDIQSIGFFIKTYLYAVSGISSIGDCFDYVHNIRSYYIYGSSRLGITDLVPGLAFIEKYIRSFDVDDAALAAAIVGNEEAYRYVCGIETECTTFVRVRRQNDLATGSFVHRQNDLATVTGPPVRLTSIPRNYQPSLSPSVGAYVYDVIREDVLNQTKIRVKEYARSMPDEEPLTPILLMNHGAYVHLLDGPQKRLVNEYIRQGGRLRRTFPEFFLPPDSADKD